VLFSFVSLTDRFNHLQNTSSRGKAATTTARYARIPKNELLDLLFTQFSSAPYWSLRSLNDHVKQPQVYLKEVLGEIATLVPKGPYAQMYALKPEFKGTTSSGGGQAGSSSAAGGSGGVKQEQQGEGVKREQDADDDDDDDDSDGMEVVS
jgi:transcription initiation factor TFIIF subunit beta